MLLRRGIVKQSGPGTCRAAPDCYYAKCEFAGVQPTNPGGKGCMSWAITGTRSDLTSRDRDAIANVLIHLDVSRQPGEPFHHGDAKGVDRYAADLVKGWGLIPKAHPADWDQYGKAAGAIRNRDMLEIANPELLFAFPRRELPNRGTLDCVKAAMEREINFLLVWLEP